MRLDGGHGGNCVSGYGVTAREKFYVFLCKQK